MSDDEYDTHCPLCCEEMDLSDRNFLPCPCGYKVCMWCWHHIRENMNGLCPACRTPYNSDPHAFSAVDREDVVKLKKEKRQKEKQEKKTAERVVVSAPGAGVKSTASTVTDRRHLHNYRVVQRNLVYVIGVPANYASEENLRKPEFFGQYGKIGKVVIHRNHSSVHSTVSVYVTFVYKEDARASIQSLDGHWLDQNHLLRASFGTTKYCNNFIRGVPCNNPECVYLHDLGDDDDRFTKEEIQAGHSKIPPVPGKDQTLVTGGGGPSGTGKRPTGEPILPPPVFIQDNYPVLGSNPTPSTSAAAAPAGLGAPPGVATANVMPAPGLSAVGSASTASTVPAVPPGVGIVLGRPAAASRNGTGTWGSANTIAAITGAASVRSASTEREREQDREREREREREELRESHSNTPLHFPPLSSSVSSSNLHSQGQSEDSNSRVPTAVLKRSASSTTNMTTLSASASAAASASVVDPTPVASVSNSSAATSTPAITTAVIPVVPAAAGAVKTKPKTAKEIAREAAAEKKAAAAAVRAEKLALAAQSAATATATASGDTTSTAPANSTSGEAESKSSTTTTSSAPAIAPTPKLSAKQQMLANKAEKAAKAQAAALAAQEAREAARAAKESAKAAAREHALALHNGGMSKKDLKNANSAATSAATSSASAANTNTSETLPPAHDSTLDLSILQQVASPVASMLESPPEYALVQGFNGLSVNSLFPVPVSSLSCSVWSNILRASNEDLLINPYGVLEVPVSELLDLMLPPVDAMLSASPCWPRPLAYYTQGMQAGGVTFSPAGKHLHQRSTNDMALLPPMLQMLPSSVTQQQHHQHSQQQGREQDVTLSPAEQAAQAQRRSKVTALLQAITTEAEETVAASVASVPALAPPPGVSVPAAAARGPAPGAVRSNGRTAGPAHLPPPPGVTPVVSAASTGAASAGPSAGGAAVGATNMNALRQLFPGVKMSVSTSK